MGTAMARMAMGACQGSCMLLIALQSSEYQHCHNVRTDSLLHTTCMCSSGDLRLQE